MNYLSNAELEAILDDDDDDEAFELLSDDDDDDESFEEGEDELYDLYGDDDDDDEAEFGDDDDDDEAERRYFRRRRFRGRRSRGRRFRRSPRRRFAIKGKKTARVMTRNGRSATVRFSQSFATAKQLKAGLDRLAKDIRKNGTGIVRLDKEIKRVDGTNRKAMVKQNNRLSKFEKSVKKQIADAKKDAQQAALLPLLIGSGDDGDGDGLGPIALLALSGGLGGASGSSGGLDPIALLAISGKL